MRFVYRRLRELLVLRCKDHAIAMPHTFGTVSFKELAADAQQLAARADHERRLAAIVSALDPDRVEEMAETLRTHLIGNPSAAAGDAEKRPLVLIVEDSANSRDVAAMLLQTSGFDDR